MGNLAGILQQRKKIIKNILDVDSDGLKFLLSRQVR